MSLEDLEVEAVIWCPRCNEDRAVVRRKPTDREGVYTHVIELKGTLEMDNGKYCIVCDGILERRRG